MTSLVSRVNIAKQHVRVFGLIHSNVFYSTESFRGIQLSSPTDLKRGGGGRSSFNGMVVTIFGATGFAGRYVCNKFGKIGAQLILPYRADHYEAMRLKLVGDLGQVLFQFYDLKDYNSIKKAVKYSNIVVNLVGRDWETRNFSFKDVHVDGARAIAKACREAGVDRLIHVSSLNAEPNPEPLIIKSGSKFLSSKYHGELAVRDEFPNATIIRPADIYGQEDRFIRYYAHTWRHQLRMLPLWQKGEKTIKQPVFVSDVAQAIVNVAKDPDTAGKIYQAVGPRRYLLSEIVDWFHRVMRKDAEWGYLRYDLRWDPSYLIKVKINKAICPSFPVADLHLEKTEREHVTDVVKSEIPTLEDLGVNLTKMEDQVPWELRPYRAAQYYDEELGEFEMPAPPKYLEMNSFG